MGFDSPTPIQSAAIPRALEGRDLLACAATGSGKTAAFLLPILHELVDRPRGKTRALVLAPTRELALQILADLESLARHTGVKGAAIHGGVSMGPQERAFRRGADVLIATPGRLLDHFQYGYATLPELEYLVLDEADRMLDMGFLPDIRRVLRHVPKPKQTFFFSATMPPPIETLTREILRKPAKIALQRRAAPAKGVKQVVYPVRQARKGALLVELLKTGQVDDALVFTRTKHRANRLAKLLERNGIQTERIHGNRSQAQRTKALAGFKAGRFQILVATDIAARGIDVEALGHVVNFDIPALPDDYIHRVGRTARASATGEAITLVAPEDERTLKLIERTVGSKIQRVVLDGFEYDGKEDTPLEVPIRERLAEMRAQRARKRTPSNGASSNGSSGPSSNKRRGGTAKKDGTPRSSSPNGGSGRGGRGRGGRRGGR